ncbi:MAG: 7-carboxy-7-deazaguanine synthase QueE [Pirellulales bacterium]|nr:7-carboxy-7-deazaguanine synthase QueE [Pirellulales bacterium]
MRIAEIFRSIQGEGRLTGTPSVFVRTSGCNLRCRYCDTPYASWTPEGDDWAVEEIVDRVGQLARPADKSAAAVRHVVLTGGEPMLFAELIPLSAELRRRGWHVTVETAGTLYLPVECDLMSISPKLSNATPPPDQDPRWSRRHEAHRHVPEVIRRLVAEYEYQVKLVVACLEDCREVETYLKQFPEIDRGRVMLMPRGTEADELAEKARWLEPYCAQHRLSYCPRRQIEWFGSRRGT